MNKFDELNKTGKTIITGATPKLSSLASKVPIIKGADFAEKIAAKRAALGALKKSKGMFKGGSGVLGLVLGAITAAQTGDASAAIPILNEAESAGPTMGSPAERFENNKMSPEEYQEFLKSRGK